MREIIPDEDDGRDLERLDARSELKEFEFDE
jgi:hypothetical protein